MTKGPYLLHDAIDKKRRDILRTLLEAGFNPRITDAYGLEPIHHAVFQRRGEDIKLLVKYGADINALLVERTETTGYPIDENIEWHKLLFVVNDTNPLQAAGVALVDEDLLKLIIGLGADVNIEFPTTGDVPFNTFCMCRFLGTAKIMIEAGAKIDHQDRRHGFSPVFWTINCNNRQLMKMIISRGANVNQVSADSTGRKTPLHLAACYGLEREWFVRTLVAAGADRAKLDAEGRTPRDVALQAGYPEDHEVVALLSPPRS
jgi:ankyrin repeat protein